MAVATHVGTGTPVSLTTTAAVGYPTGLAANDLVFLAAASGDSTVGSAPSGWTLVTSATQGSTNIALFKKDTVSGSESGTVTVTTASGTKGRAWMTAYRAPGGYTTAVQSSQALTDATSNTDVAVTGSMTTTTDDLLACFVMGAGDFTAGLFTGFNITQTGATLSSLTVTTNGRTGTNTMQHFGGHKSVTTGATAATVTATGTGNATGATGAGVGIVLRSTAAGGSGYPVKVKVAGTFVSANLKVRQGGAWVTPANITAYHPATAATDERTNMPWNLQQTYGATPPVMAHYVPWFPQRANSAGTYYQNVWMKPGAVESGTDHRLYGGFIRDMPPAQGAGGTTYKADDMYLEVTRAAAAKIDGFFVDIVGIGSTSQSITNLALLFDAADRYYTETGRRFWITPMLDCHATASASVLQAGSTTLADVTASANAVADAFAPFMAEPALWKHDGAIVLPIYAPEFWGGRSNPTSDRVTFFSAMKSRLATYGHAVSFWYCYQQTWTDYAGTFNSGAFGHGRWGDRDAVATAAANNYNVNAPSYCHTTYSKPWMHFVSPGDQRPNDSRSLTLTYSTTASSSSGASTVTYSTGNAANIYKGCTIKFANHTTVYTVSQINRSTGVATLTSALTAAVPSSTSSTITRNYYRYWEQLGSQTFENTWTAAINGQAEAVQITTWNDYAEHAHIAKTVNHGSVWLDLTTYWLHKYKTEAFPTIVRDGLYLFHRRQPVGLYNFGSSLQTRYGRVDGSTSAADNVEVLAFLTSSATIQLLVDGVVTQTASGVAGMNRFTWALPSSGTISARAQRASVTVSGTVVTSDTPIASSDVADDFHYRAFSSLRQSTGT